MPMQLTDEQQALRDAVRDFAARECGTREQRDALTNGGRRSHSPELHAKIAALGWLGVALPEEYGGAGGGAVDLCLFLEDAAYWMLPIAGYTISRIAVGPYLRFGSEELKRDVVGGVVDGKVAAIAMSEPGAGSDVGAMQCRAERGNGGFTLDGQKTWCSEAHVADTILVVARTSRDGAKHDGLTMFSVPVGIHGLEVRGIPTMGGEVVNDVFLTEVHLAEEAVIGAVDAGWKQLMAGLNLERLIISAGALGRARRAFDDVLAYVGEREQFGRPIGTFQAIKHRLADLAVEIHAVELMVYDAARAFDDDATAMLAREASMAKLKATEVAKRMSLEGMQMMGGYGYATEYEMEGHVRRNLMGTIAGGTSEIQREVIAMTLGIGR